MLDLTAWAWDAVMGPLLDALPADPRIVLVPGGGGALVPWHAAWPAGADATDPRPATARATISYAPHRQALAAAHDLARRAGRPRHLLSVVDPGHSGTAPLPEAAAEAALLARHWLDRDLSPATAARAAVDDLRTIDHVHECEELGDPAPSAGVPARFRPHAHPARWAASICTGW